MLDRENLVRKIEFPRLVVPIAVILLAYFNLVLNLLAVLVFVLLTGVDVRVEWLALPLLLIPLGMFASGLAMLLSALYVRFRDVQPIWEVLLQVAFYGSPILYVIEQLPSERAADLVIWFNPLATILVQARHWLIDQSAPTASQRRGRRRVPADPGRDHPRCVRARLLGLQPRGAADRGGAVSEPGTDAEERARRAEAELAAAVEERNRLWAELQEKNATEAEARLLAQARVRHRALALVAGRLPAPLPEALQKRPGRDARGPCRGDPAAPARRVSTVTVAIPVLNGARYLDEVLAAVRAQRVDRDVEILIVDSGSTDGSLEIAAATAPSSTRSTRASSRTAARATG